MADMAASDDVSSSASKDRVIRGAGVASLTALVLASLIQGCRLLQPAPATPRATTSAAASASPNVTPATIEPSPAVIRDLAPIGPVGGAGYAVVVRDDYAYVGSGPRLLTLDVSDPRSPRVIGQSAPLGVDDVMTRSIRDLAGMGPYLVAVTGVERDYDEAVFAASGQAGEIFLLDVSEPSQPRVLSSFSFTQPAWGVDVLGTLAFVANGSGGVRIVDFSSPSSPQQLTPFWTPGFTFDVRISSPYAYVASSGGGLGIMDISLPQGPSEVAFVDTPGRAVALALSDGFVYLADRSGGLRVIDVTDPLHPHETASLDQMGEAIDVAVSGDLAYVVDRNAGLHILDRTDPARPVEVATIGQPYLGTRVYPSGNLAFVSGELGGIGVVDVSDPARPRLAGAVELPHESSGLALAGSHAYLADGLNGLWSLDLSDLTRPSLLSRNKDASNAQDIVLDEGLAYVADTSFGLRVYVSETGSLQPIVEFPMEPGPVSILVVNERAYLVDEAGALIALDISRPETPVLLWEYTSPAGRVNDVFVADSYALVADPEIGLVVLDLSQPGGPEEIGRLEPPIPPEDPAFILLTESEYAPGAITVFGDDTLAYLIGPNGVLWICNLSDPKNPVVVGDYRPEMRFLGLSADLTIAGSYAYYVYHADEAYYKDYLVEDQVGLIVIDISDPGHPSEATHFTAFRETLDRDYPFWPPSLAVSAVPPYVTISGWSRELWILQTLAEKPARPTPSLTPTLRPTATEQAPARGLEPTAAPVSFPPGAQPVELDTLKMIGPRIGWGIGGPPDLRAQHILRTSDGGQTWTDVTPPELLDGEALSETAYPRAFFLDENSAWVTYRQEFPIPSGARVVWRTTDGGMSWQPSEPLGIAGEEGEVYVANYYGPLALVFLDRSTGWLAVNQTTAMMQGDLAILRTTNGGATWEQIYASSTCDFRGLAFLDSRQGYMAEDCALVVTNSSILDTTSDGGATWEFLDRPPAASPVPTPDPCDDLCTVRAITASPPDWISFVLHHERTASSPRGAEFLYVSSDAGMTWHTSSLPTDAPPDTSTLILRPSGHGWLLDRANQTLFFTDDLGANWVPLRSVGWCGKLEFADDDTGWAVAWDCSIGYSGYPEESLFLLRTLDGGRTWEQLDPHVVP